MKLGAKWAVLVQKFVLRSRIGFFCNERTRSTPLTLNSCFGTFVQFWCIWDRLVALRNSVRNGPNWCKSSCHEVASEFFTTNATDLPHWTLNSRFGAFHTNLVHLGSFGCLAKLGAKRGELVQKFVPRSRFGIFHNERNRSTPLDPKLKFRCISYKFGAFGTIWLLYETRCKMGRIGAKVRATKSRRNFLQ